MKVLATRVTHGFFDVFGIRPAIGRGFTAVDDGPGTASTAVLSYGLWQSAFGGDSNVVGRRFQLDDEAYTVIGVMPAGFAAFEAGFNGPESADLWIDMQPTVASLAPLGPNLDFLARLRAGVSPAQADAELAIERAAYLRSRPDTSGGARLQSWDAQSYHAELFDVYSLPLLLMLGAVGLVLLLACANMANLFLSRSAVREREMVIRAVLGAGPGRLVRQVLTECLFLAFCGAAFGCLLAWWSVPWLERLAPAGYALPVHGRLDLYVLVFTVGATVLVGVLFGLAPALSMHRLQPNAAIRGGRCSRSRSRNLLIAGEVAVAFMLLAATGLLASSLLRMYRVDPGFDARDVLTAQTTMAGRNVATTAATAAYIGRVLTHLRAIPGITAAAAITGLPLTRAMNYAVRLPGGTAACQGRRSGSTQIEWRAISPGYLASLRIPLQQGRGFTASDSAAGEPVAIVNREFARRCWASGNAIGQAVAISTPGKVDILRKIVGVAGDVHEDGLNQPAPNTFYVPQAQVPDGMNKLVNHWFSMGFVVRGQGGGVAAAVRRAFAAADPSQPVFHFRSLGAVKGDSLAPYRFMSGLLAFFTALALALSAIGIYGVLSNTVVQCRREIGIRRTVGADRGDVLRQFIGEGVRWAVLGLAAGLLAALALARVLGSFLFEIAPTDPVVLAGTAAVLLLLAASAALLPALRAASVDPVTALRSE